MISPWKWVQVPHQLYLVWENELNGICSLSVETYTIILCRCNSPGTPGAADILCAGDWASDWSCLHGSPRWSCPTRTQGAGLTVYPFIPLDLERKTHSLCFLSCDQILPKTTLWNLFSQVTQLASYFDPLIVASVGLASKLQDHQQQMTILDQTKTLSESALQMLYAAKEGGGNPKVLRSSLSVFP